MRTLVIKTVGTAGVVLLLSYPLWAPQWGSGILGEFWNLGLPWGVVAVAAFFGLVALYCRVLQRTLMLVTPEARVAAPASVWWMFAIPYNFVEDFFIVANVGASLRRDGRVSAVGARVWTALGILWCGFQLLSLFPGLVGFIGGAVALVAWAAHWILAVRVTHLLARDKARVPVSIA